MRGIAVVALAGACGFSGSGDRDGGGGDGPIDARVDAIPGDARSDCEAWDPQHFDPCAIPAPGETPWTLSGEHTYDTTTDLLDGAPIGDTIGPGRSTVFDQDGGVPARLLSVAGFTMEGGSTLHVVGDNPLIIASWGDITIGGTLDAGSYLGGVTGAGADAGGCGAIAATAGGNADSGGGSGGGGGGAFSGNGGDGGQGDDSSPAPGGSGGNLLPLPPAVRGGCSGAPGGAAGPGAQPPSDATTRSAGGKGGGAIQVTARAMLRVEGAARVLAGGSGGAGSRQGSGGGGGGGGAGGYVGLEGATVVVNGRLAANGGGGGASNTFTGIGDPGDNGRPDRTAAAGGAPVGTCATAGGVGGAGATLDGASVTGTVSCGGGGGGGGTGYVLVWSADYTQAGGAITSPDPIVMP